MHFFFDVIEKYGLEPRLVWSRLAATNARFFEADVVVAVVAPVYQTSALTYARLDFVASAFVKWFDAFRTFGGIGEDKMKGRAFLHINFCWVLRVK